MPLSTWRGFLGGGERSSKTHEFKVYISLCSEAPRPRFQDLGAWPDDTFYKATAHHAVWNSLRDVPLYTSQNRIPRTVLHASSLLVQ